MAALFVLALALPIAFFQRLLGMAGTGIGLLVFIVVGDPSSGGATAPQLLPEPWRAVSQGLPPGAAVTAMCDAVYFHGYGATRALLVLGSYAVLGGILAIMANRIRLPELPSFCSTGLSHLAELEQAERDARRGALDRQVPRVTPLR